MHAAVIASRTSSAAVLLVLCSAAVSAMPAQSRPSRWKEIGPTSSGNMVSVDPRTIKRTGNLVAATVRVVFTTPVQTPRGPWSSSQTTATFDCAKKSLAAKANVYYADRAEKKVTERKVNALPGFGPALGGSLGAVALNYLCALK
jgi:hypothetical protein